MLTVKPAYDLPTMSEASAITKDSEVLTAVVIQPPIVEGESRVEIHKRTIRWLGQLKRDVFSDLRSAPWLRLVQGYLLAIWLCGLVYVRRPWNLCGSRRGCDKGMCQSWTFPDAEAVSVWCSWVSDWYSRNFGYPPVVLSMHRSCEFAKNISDYVRTYGFFGLDSQSGDKNDVATTWMGTSVPKPALNISAFYLPLGSNYFWGHDWVDPRTTKRPFSGPSGAAMAVDGTSTAYSLDYVQQNGSCQPQGTYQWGFAFLQVFIVVIVLLVWTIATYVMWLGPHKSLRRLGAKETPRKYGAAMSLVTGITRELKRIA
ncbi:hypothetical protein V8F33_008758 [Rhypophila sp. PSN 637]